MLEKKNLRIVDYDLSVYLPDDSVAFPNFKIHIHILVTSKPT